jgi:hypothetical protein
MNLCFDCAKCTDNAPFANIGVLYVFSYYGTFSYFYAFGQIREAVAVILGWPVMLDILEPQAIVTSA